MKKFLKVTFLLLFIGFGYGTTFAQVTGEVGKLYLSGKVVNENKRGLESTFYVYKNRKLLGEYSTSGIGKFAFEVNMQDSVAFVVYSEGYVSKTYVVSTQIHESKQKKDHAFPCFIDLYPVGRIPSPVDLDRPVGRIQYHGGQFIYDPDFTKESNEKLKEFIRERKDLAIKEIED